MVGRSSTDLQPREILLRRLRGTSQRLFWSEHDKEEYECPGCGVSDVTFEVHHRDGDPFNNHLINLIGVCHTCHKKAHRQENRHESLEAWKDSLVDVVND